MSTVIHGKTVYTELDEILHPDHTALVVVDMQNDLCLPNVGWGTKADISMVREIIPPLRGLVDAARDHRVPVIWLQMVWRAGEGYRSVSPAYLRFFIYKCGFAPGEKVMEEGTWGAQNIPELEVRPGEAVIQKARSSGFVGTDLDLLLRSNGVKTVVITGIATQACMESTLRDALGYDYYTVLVRDCVAAYRKDLHDASLKILETMADVVPAARVAETWTRARGAALTAARGQAGART
ncbi:MAG: cysteine hydrolase [Armatimonadetes bacterium]|nr:cysteine hydrolase [Armatimonadota bacterium]